MASSMEQYFLEIVSGRRCGLGAKLIRVVLQFLSWPYAAVTIARNWLYDRGWKRSFKAEALTVSIGNLTLGGTGKTPAVEYVARFYQQHGRRVSVLSRGYGVRSGRNDEALVLENNLHRVPHLQGPDRRALARTAIEEWKSDILVLDDGFQHRRLQRDLDIVLIDATNPWGYGRVFPAGLLREPRLGVRRAHLVLLTRCDQVPAESVDALDAEVKRLAPGVPVVRSRHIPLRLVNGNREAPTARLNGRPVSAFCGIGNPAAFYRTLQALGCRPAAFEVFPDHHCYSPADIERLHAWARRTSDDTWIVTTQKDLVKIQLETLGDRPLWAVAIALIPTEGQEALDAKLNGVLA